MFAPDLPEGTPAWAALVANPARSECPEYPGWVEAGSRYSLPHYHRDSFARQARVMDAAVAVYGPEYRPFAMPDAASQASSAATGHHRVRPNGMAIFWPWPSWSVFERRR